MKRLHFIICILLGGWFAMIQTAVAQSNYFFTHISSQNGLSENNVKSMAQDHWGFVWLGTKNGLNRYDGVNIKHYDVDDLQRNHGNHNISALCEDDDYNLWIGTDKGVFIYNPYNETFRFFDLKTAGGERIQNWIAQIAQDRQGNIWIISPDEGAFRYDRKRKTLSVYRPSGHKSAEGNPLCVLVRANGELWLGTNGAGLYRYVYATRKLEHHRLDSGEAIAMKQNIYTMCDYNEHIVIADHLGKLLKYNPNTRQLSDVDAPQVHYKVLRALCYDGRNLFVGTQDGLYIINESRHAVECVKENDLLPNGLSDNRIYSLMLDRDNGVWVGTMQSGANYLSRKGIQFYSFVPLGNKASLSDKRIREMVRVAGGDVWIATEEGNLNIFHSDAGTIEWLSKSTLQGGTNRLALMVDGDYVWSGLFKNGLDIINIKTREVTHFPPEKLGLHPGGSVYALYRDRQGTVWLGTEDGLYRRTEGLRFERIKAMPYIFCQDIVQDAQGSLWISTIGFGVYRYNPVTGKVTTFVHHNNDGGSLSSNDVSSITIDSRGLVWFSTDRGGLCVFNPRTSKFHTFSKADGLPDDMVYKVLEDRNHYLWFGTNQGLVRMLPSQDGSQMKNVRVYHNITGLRGNQYNYKSAIATADGRFLFGGSCGLVFFDPHLAIAKDPGRHIYVTNIRVNNQEVKAGNSNILERNIIHSPDIRLPYDFSTLSLDVSSLNYSGIEGYSYEYKLDGVNTDWIFSKDGRNINYSKLQPGEYTLYIRSVAHPDHVTKLHVTVEHPWWSSIPARFVYGLLLVTLLFVIYRYMLYRQRKHLEHSVRQLREERDKELMRSKINFFTDITHEIRTPLTLINGSVENLGGKIGEDAALQRDLNAVQKNCRRLLNLINQLLDFRKSDTNSMSLNFVNTDVCQLVRDVIDRFEPSLSATHKSISLDVADDSIIVPVDREALTKIISNMLNNARKYSETFVQVGIERKEDCLEITVDNDGAKIPADKAEEIFKPFTRLTDDTTNNSGTGIGLPLARSLAELHQGTLTLDTDSEYNTFVLRLPTRQDNVIVLDDRGGDIISNVLDNAAIEDYENVHSDDRYTVLLVEDNPEVLDMLVSHLRDHYQLLCATDGHQALHLVKKEHVNLIVSDIMMPVMDGIELTRRVKDDQEINHIPIILLTARQTLNDRIEGLRAGADAYIEKPFSFAHLTTQMESLINNRQRERESYLHRPYLSVQSSNISKADEDFLNKISNLVIMNIKDADFNVERLSQEMCMSRSSLHRKIKEVADMTPIDFIRLIKLKKAAELIREQGYRSTEVCEMIGFSSPSYFIKLFQKQFGMTPKEFASGKETAQQ